MLVDATERDIRTLSVIAKENRLDEEIMVQSFRLKGDKFVIIINSILSESRWQDLIKPMLIEGFGEARCRFESETLMDMFEELVRGGR
jgi:hypothetical protein